MYLTALDIHGFKSFANKVTIQFPKPTREEQSVTAIVGPNGSGKSNIADAIRWVLGEQRLKTLRGKKSDDVIFSGSASKGRMSVAAVTLAIDNRDHRLPVDYDELTITRRLYRSGESEYLINGATVRLIDLQLLLARAQFGQGSYSVIGQGMIDRLLLQTPVERKDFFDEAFGIKEFQIKRHQSELKLIRTKEHMREAEALLLEVTPRLKSLSRQVKKLEERQNIATRLGETQEAYYLTLWQSNEQELQTLRGLLAELDRQYRTTEDKLTAIQAELSSLAKEASRQQVFANLQSRYQEVQMEKHRLERDRAAHLGRRQVEYSKAGKQNVVWLEEKIAGFKEKQAVLDASLGATQDRIHALQRDLATDKAALDTLSMQRAQLRGRLAQYESQLHDVKGEQALWQWTGLIAVQAIIESGDRFGRIFGALAQLAEVDDRYQVAMDVAAGQHVSSLVVAHDGVAEACIRFLREEHLGVATFLPLSTVKPRLVSHDLEALAKRPGVHGIATALARFDERFAPIFSYVFGNTLIVDDIAVARAIGIGRARMVTLEGDVCETSGSMKGGYRQAKNSGMSFAHRRGLRRGAGDTSDMTERMESARQELETTDRAIAACDAGIRAREVELQLEEQKQALTAEQKQTLDRELAALEQELSLSSLGPADYTVVMRQVEDEVRKMEETMTTLDATRLLLERDMQRFHEEEEKKKQRIFALQDAMQVEQKTLNDLGAARGERRIQAAKLETKQEDLENEVFQELHASLMSIARRDDLPRLTPAELDAAQKEMQKLKYQLTLIGGIDEGVQAEYEETRSRHGALDAQLTDLRQALTDLERLIEELDGHMKKRRKKAFREIRKEFKRYFGLLFDGGEADMIELYTESLVPEATGSVGEGDETEIEAGAKPWPRPSVLEGIDILACPPGKKINTIQALSGGERTLTSIALICAILHTNPPPFVVLDEVEAALDEANTVRFTQILRELSRQSQFVLITHNRVTMHAADALYGVTMGVQGVSQLLSVRLEGQQESG